MSRLGKYKALSKIFIVFTLITMLSGCEWMPFTRVVEVPTPILPPEEYIKHCEVEEYKGSTYGDREKLLSNVLTSLHDCNVNMKALRKWRENNDINNDKKKESK